MSNENKYLDKVLETYGRPEWVVPMKALIKEFGEQGHSGASAEIYISMIDNALKNPDTVGEEYKPFFEIIHNFLDGEELEYRLEFIKVLKRILLGSPINGIDLTNEDNWAEPYGDNLSQCKLYSSLFRYLDEDGNVLKYSLLDGVSHNVINVTRKWSSGYGGVLDLPIDLKIFNIDDYPTTHLHYLDDFRDVCVSREKGVGDVQFMMFQKLMSGINMYGTLNKRIACLPISAIKDTISSFNDFITGENFASKEIGDIQALLRTCMDIAYTRTNPPLETVLHARIAAVIYHLLEEGKTYSSLDDFGVTPREMFVANHNYTDFTSIGYLPGRTDLYFDSKDGILELIDNCDSQEWLFRKRTDLGIPHPKHKPVKSTSIGVELSHESNGKDTASN